MSRLNYQLFYLWLGLGIVLAVPATAQPVGRYAQRERPYGEPSKLVSSEAYQ